MTRNYIERNINRNQGWVKNPLPVFLIYLCRNMHYTWNWTPYILCTCCWFPIRVLKSLKVLLTSVKRKHHSKSKWYWTLRGFCPLFRGFFPCPRDKKGLGDFLQILCDFLREREKKLSVLPLLIGPNGVICCRLNGYSLESMEIGHTLFSKIWQRYYDLL